MHTFSQSLRPIFSENIPRSKSGFWYFEIFTDKTQILGEKKHRFYRKMIKIGQKYDRKPQILGTKAVQPNILLDSVKLVHLWFIVKELGLMGIILSFS